MPRIIHFEIPADDTDRAVRFYQKVFGWKIEKWGFSTAKAKVASGTTLEYFRFAFKGRKRNQRPFYSLVPMDVLKDCIALQAQNKIVLPLSHKGKNGKTFDPLNDANLETCRRYMESAFRTALKRAPIILSQGEPSLHELRDCFLTRAIQTNCSESAANFVMGHVLDKSLGPWRRVASN
jgi:integrase